MTARVTIQTEDFDLSAEVAALRADDAGVGAVASFIGTVRDRSTPGQPDTTHMALLMGVSAIINMFAGLIIGNTNVTAYIENVTNDDSITYVHPEAFIASKFGQRRQEPAKRLACPSVGNEQSMTTRRGHLKHLRLMSPQVPATTGEPCGEFGGERGGGHACPPCHALRCGASLVLS